MNWRTGRLRTDVTIRTVTLFDSFETGHAVSALILLAGLLGLLSLVTIVVVSVLALVRPSAGAHPMAKIAGAAAIGYMSTVAAASLLFGKQWVGALFLVAVVAAGVEIVKQIRRWRRLRAGSVGDNTTTAAEQVTDTDDPYAQFRAIWRGWSPRQRGLYVLGTVLLSMAFAFGVNVAISGETTSDTGLAVLLAGIAVVTIACVIVGIVLRRRKSVEPPDSSLSI